MLMVGANMAWLRSERNALYDQLRLSMGCCPSLRCCGRRTAIVIKHEGKAAHSLLSVASSLVPRTTLSESLLGLGGSGARGGGGGMCITAPNPREAADAAAPRHVRAKCVRTDRHHSSNVPEMETPQRWPTVRNSDEPLSQTCVNAGQATVLPREHRVGVGSRTGSVCGVRASWASTACRRQAAAGGD
jgi:hypothetical protein